MVADVSRGWRVSQLAGNGADHAQIRLSLRPAPGFAPFRYVPIAVLVALSSNPLR
jgi:hypothetical protein